MTTLSREKVKCSVCGAVNEYVEIMSTNSFGSPDLDTRPPEIQRSTMRYWVQECPSCGYAASQVSESCEVSADFLKSDEYISCDGIAFKSELAKRFYKQYMIAAKADNSHDAFFALLHAVWACDDAGDSSNAKLCRKKAASLGLLLLNSHEAETFMLMCVDLMRRAGQFEEVISKYSSLHFRGDRWNNPDVMNAVLKFELEKARNEDDGCYTITEAMQNGQQNK